MNVRIAFLITAAWLTVLACPHEPNCSPRIRTTRQIASVDRFSDKAGTLLVRSADKRLPGPNEPIDFDAQPLNTLGLSPMGKPALLYHLDVQSTTPSPVYILYRDGEERPVQGQLDIIDTLPGEKGYNDFKRV